jgi:hypothetical protein
MTLVVAATMMAVGLAAATVPKAGDRVAVPFTTVFFPPETRAEVLVNKRDGPAFAQLATDLTLDHPEAFDDYLAGSTPEQELAYRAGRPLVAWLTALLSFGGQRSLLAPALIVVTMAGLGGVAAATALLARRFGRDPSRSWVVLLVPGLLVNVFAPGGCEPLALALVLLGWAAWGHEKKAALPIFLWCLAVLARETSLVVPVALAVATPGPFRRRVAAVLAPAATYGVWLLFVRWRTGFFPGNAGGGRVSSLFRGLTDQVATWAISDWAAFVGIIVLGALAWRLPSNGVRVIVALHVVAASALGPLVWEQALDFSRVFVVVETLGLIAVLPRARPAMSAHVGAVADG